MTAFSRFVEINPRSRQDRTVVSRFVAMEDVVPGKRYVSGKKLTRAKSSGSRFEPGDVLFARITPCLENGKIAQYRPEDGVSGQGSTEFYVLRSKPGVADQGYIYYLATSALIRRPAELSMRGASGRQRASADAILSIDVPDRPLSAQKKIANILSAYDDLIEVNARRITILEEMARGLFEDRLGNMDLSNLPNGWRIVPLGDLVQEQRDAVQPAAISGETPYIGLEHLPRRSTTLLSYGRVGDVSSTKFWFQGGDILFGKIRPYFHKVAVAPFAGVASSDAIVMRPVSANARALAICLTSSDRFVAHAVQTSNGTKMPRANWGVLQKYKLAVPPEPLLSRFVQSINTNIQFCSRLAAINEKLRAARDLLLPKLISGEIDLEQAGRDADRATRRVAAA